MAAFPLYSPLICPPGWEPDFAAGSESCTLQTGDVSRSRLIDGGSLFRSVDTAATVDVNNITLQLIVGTPVVDGDIETSTVDLIITGPMVGSPVITISTTQAWDTNLSSCSLNGVTRLRAAVLAADTIITMPPVDIPSTWTDSTCLMTSFTRTMSGGKGLPVSGGSPISFESIRTGPTYNLYHVAFADTAEDGSLEEVNGISAWNPFTLSWDAFPLPTEELYEIDTDGNITPTPPCP